jgi:hypothetical protein
MGHGGAFQTRRPIPTQDAPAGQDAPFQRKTPQRGVSTAMTVGDVSKEKKKKW